MRHSLLAFFSVSLLLGLGTGCSDKKSVEGEGPSEIPEQIVDEETGRPIEAGEDFYGREAVEGLGLQPVYFGFDSFLLPSSETAKIDKVVQVLADNSSYVCIVEGHCDERGSNEYNISLGEQRAQTIRAYITAAGIAQERIQTKSFGEEKPAVTGSGESAWRLNRRGEFSVRK